MKSELFWDQLPINPFLGRDGTICVSECRWRVMALVPLKVAGVGASIFKLQLPLPFKKSAHPRTCVNGPICISHCSLSFSFVWFEIALVSVSWGIDIICKTFELVSRMLARINTSIWVKVFTCAMIHTCEPFSDVDILIMVNVAAMATWLRIHPLTLISWAVGSYQFSFTLPSLCTNNPLSNIDSIWYYSCISIF